MYFINGPLFSLVVFIFVHFHSEPVLQYVAVCVFIWFARSFIPALRRFHVYEFPYFSCESLGATASEAKHIEYTNTMQSHDVIACDLLNFMTLRTAFLYSFCKHFHYLFGSVFSKYIYIFTRIHTKRERERLSHRENQPNIGGADG